jgi:hypothetical protein
MQQARRLSFAAPSSPVALDDSRAAVAALSLAAASGLPHAPPPPPGAARLADYAHSLAELLRAAPPNHKLFVALVLFQVFLTLVERVWLFALAGPATLPPTPQFREALFFFLVILTSALSVAYFALSAMLYTNYVEMVMYFVTSLVLLGRLLAEALDRSDECREASAVGCYVQLALIGLCLLGAMVLSCSMMQELRVKRHKALGAREETQRVYFLYEVYAATRTLDLQFSVSTLFTGLVFFPSQRSGPYGTAALAATVVLLASEVAWNWLGREGVRRERAKLLWGFWALTPALPAGLLAVALETATAGQLLAEAQSPTLRGTIYVLGALTLACRLCTLGLSVALYRLFGPSYVQLRRIIESDRSVTFLRRRAQYAPAGAGGGGGEGSLNPLAAAAAGAGAAPAPGAAAAAAPSSAVADWASSKA